MTLSDALPSPIEFSFEKWHGAHNDFLFIRVSELRRAFGERLEHSLISQLTVSLTSRLSGMGADGIVLWETGSGNSSAHAGIWNSDGSRASTCGNALRCFGSLLVANGLWTGKHPFQIMELKNELKSDQPFATLMSAAWCEVSKGFQASVDMGTVIEVSPRSLDQLKDEITALFGHENSNALQSATFVQLANPHLVLHLSRGFIAQHSTYDIEKFGRFFQSEEVCRRLQIPVSNIGFIEMEPNEANDSYAGVVFERGAGLTQCCGSGGCAMLLSSQLFGWFDNRQEIQISMPGGIIRVSRSQSERLVLSGPAKKVGEFQAKYWS